MRLAQSTIAFQDKHLAASDQPFPTTISEIVDRWPELGWDGIEIWYPHVAGLDDPALDALAQQLRHQGLAVPMLSSYFNFTSSAEHAADSMAHGHEVIRRGHILGAEALRIFTGKHRSADADEQQWQRCADCLQELCDTAAAHGIVLALHMHDWNLIDTVAGTRRLINMVERANLRVLSKPSIYAPEHLAVHEALADVLQGIHLTAAHTIDGRSVPCRLAESDLDWPACIAHLRQLGYDGWLTLNWMAANGWAMGRDAAAWLRTVLDELEER